MTPEPLHLAGIVKYCRRCGNNDVKYMYNNNGKSDQPRYKCLSQECRAFFTYGGKCRGPYGGKRPRVSVERHTSNRIGVITDCSNRIAKPNPGALSRRVRIKLRVFPKSAPFEVKRNLDEDPVGVVGSAAIGARRSCISNASSANSNCLSSASRAQFKFEQKLSKSYEGSAIKAAESSTGAVIVDQRKASKGVHEGTESKVESVKAILGTAPYELVPAVKSKQLKRIRVKHQEREFIIEYFS